jgi:hypothetical protein
VTILDINHSVPKDLHAKLKEYPIEDMVGMFHCGNTATRLLKNPEKKHQVIMKRLMEPDTLLALGWYYEHPRRAKRHARHYAPTWDELTSTIRLALKMEDGTRKLAKYSGCAPSQVSRYFAAKPSMRRQPNGEFALVAWKWMDMLVKRDRMGSASTPARE